MTATSKYPIIKDQEWISPVTYNLVRRFDYEGCNIDWTTARVLDFGCNVGNYVNWSSEIVPRENYVGLDINEKFINLARIIHPEYQFVHCNKWHQSYNPTGVKNLSIRDCLEGEFDVVVANSVFSHATVEQIRAEISEIYSVLKPGGSLITTFFTERNLQHFLSYVSNIYTITSSFSVVPYESSLYLIDLDTFIADQDSVEIDECISFVSFYKTSKLAELFTGAEVVSQPGDVVQTLVKFTKPV
jgi:2-polyprenyl-3-methyl-5-hydroxy-6-metoxy-1,4-benzoquinol methylase